MGKTVYILGAGSSISSTKNLYPSIFGIFKKAWELEITSINKHVLSEYKELDNYLRKTFGLSISDRYKKLDYEKVFTFVDIEYDKGYLKFGLLKQNLLTILESVFMKLKNKLDPDQESEYGRFIKAINPQDTIITYNWDVLLDDTLGREFFLNKTFYPKNNSSKSVNPNGPNSYSFFITALKNDNYRYKDLSQNGNFGFYLKLHGSVDWHKCENSECKSFNKVFPTLFPLKERLCDECLEPTNTELIPPTLNKSISSEPLIRKQWNIAIEELKLAEKLVFWGYGLPPTDFNTEWLIRQTRNSDNLKNIYIINPDRRHRKRIKLLFKQQTNPQLIKEYKNFEEFYPEFTTWHREDEVR
ncbi:MAG TPA: hypothetical protein PLP19_14725 [bacterium]|nr:hypothetical protein [bacterium]HPN44744.1 hypothetical protein [bacterium]